jgi:hypothetical protein
VTDIDEIFGSFNAGIEGNPRVIGNELNNVGEGRFVNYDALKSIITHDTVNVNQKNVPRKVTENTANSPFTTSDYPMAISNSHRRYFVIS